MLQQKDIIEKIQTIAQKTIPDGGRIFLFGSQARGDFHAESDWDILILLDKVRIENSDFDKVAYPIIEMGWKMGVQINPLLYTFKSWEQRHFTLFYKNVQKDSIELCH